MCSMYMYMYMYVYVYAFTCILCTFAQDDICTHIYVQDRSVPVPGLGSG